MSWHTYVFLVVVTWPLISLTLMGLLMSLGSISTVREIYDDFYQTWHPSLFAICAFPFVFSYGLSSRVVKGVVPLLSNVSPLLIGVSAMKRKLFAALLCASLGYLAPNLLSTASNWWNAPPNPPSPEAQKLIASLQDASGWNVAGREDKTVWLNKGPVAVRPCSWKADVEVNAANANPNFSGSDLSAINTAAQKCLRQITVRGLNQPTGCVVEDGDEYAVKLPNGKEFRVSRKSVDGK